MICLNSNCCSDQSCGSDSKLLLLRDTCLEKDANLYRTFCSDCTAVNWSLLFVSYAVVIYLSDALSADRAGAAFLVALV